MANDPNIYRRVEGPVIAIAREEMIVIDRATRIIFIRNPALDWSFADQMIHPGPPEDCLGYDIVFYTNETEQRAEQYDYLFGPDVDDA